MKSKSVASIPFIQRRFFRCRIFHGLGIALLALTIQSVCAEIDNQLLEGLSALSLGPAAVSGRITAIDAVTDDPNHIVIGTASGGVWISDNGGLTWTPVFDDEKFASIGAVAINQVNPEIIWVGSGEGNTRNSTSIGGGLFKSIDGGKTWMLVGLADSERINRIALHPSDANTVYVAALGKLWGENDERGIYKTSDGGENWTRILYAGSRTGGTDVKIDPFNPDKVYASLWQHGRQPWFFNSGGPESGLYISWDGGQHWQRRTQEDGLPEGELGRITLAPSPAQQGRVYALVEAETSALLRSEDGGLNWTRVNEQYDIAVRPFYYTEIAADPQNPDRLYNIFTRLSVSIDGGKTFEPNPAINCCAASNTVHIDSHAFWINPNDSSHLIIGNDGGIAISRDQGATWRFVRNLPLSQFYHIAVDNDLPYHIYGGLQDNGSWRGPSEVWENGGIRNFHWQEVAFGDGFDTLPDPQNSRRGYAMSQGGNLYRWNLDNGEMRAIKPNPPSPDAELRFNWNAGLEQDPFDPATIYYGSQFLHKSTDRGISWTIISADMTSNDPAMQTYKDSGGLTPDVTTAENYTSIVAVAASPLQPGLLWVGSDDGRIHVTRDGGQNWARIDQRSRHFPAGAWVPMIAPSAHQAGTAFVVADDHRRSDMRAHVFRVDDFGRRWTRLSSDGVEGYALSILQDPVDPNLIFLGTELGLYFSTNGGADWSRFSAGVPTASVMDMAIQSRENDLVLGTHGRSIYVIDDYSALRGLDEKDFTRRLRILSVTPGQQYVASQAASTRFTGSGEFRAENEPYGVMVTFMVSGDDLPHPNEERERARAMAQRIEAAGTQHPTDDEAMAEKNDKQNNGPPTIKVQIYETDGTVVRTFKSPVYQGINRITWPLVRDGVRDFPGPQRPKPDADLPAGPQVPPGSYALVLTLENPQGEPTEASLPVTVLPDPRSPYSAQTRLDNYSTLLALMDLQEDAVAAVERIDSTRRDLGTISTLIAAAVNAGEDENLTQLTKSIKALQSELNDVEERFRVRPETKGVVYSGDKVTSAIFDAYGYVSSTMDGHSPAAQIYIDRAQQRLALALEQLDQFMAQKITPLAAQVAAAGIGLLSSVE